ncbi:MAG: GatB/YqeY domain-containing protein [Pyrinomonas methylaliphatogenes]|nr:GatB/YqeY domain-containing protein [Pyrinomonas methylaliphatogenes]
MSLKRRILSDMTAAMKSQDALRTSTLRMVKAALTNREIEKGGELSDDEIIKMLRSLIKQRQEAAEQYERGGRQELADKERAEIEIIESYLPQAATPEEIERAVADAIAETGATSIRDMGKVMKAAQARLAGRSFDGRTVSELVKAKLS